MMQKWLDRCMKLQCQVLAGPPGAFSLSRLTRGLGRRRGSILGQQRVTPEPWGWRWTSAARPPAPQSVPWGPRRRSHPTPGQRSRPFPEPASVPIDQKRNEWSAVIHHFAELLQWPERWLPGSRRWRCMQTQQAPGWPGGRGRGTACRSSSRRKHRWFPESSNPCWLSFLFRTYCDCSGIVQERGLGNDNGDTFGTPVGVVPQICPSKAACACFTTSVYFLLQIINETTLRWSALFL